jgi:hypothetical protein
MGPPFFLGGRPQPYLEYILTVLQLGRYRQRSSVDSMLQNLEWRS